MRAQRNYRKFTDALVLDSGAVLPGFTVAYEIYGQMSPERDNVILICPSLTKDCHAAGFDAQGRRGWWDQAIGPGRMLATDRYCVLCISSLGGACGCTGPASFNPETGAPYALNFPVFTVRDMVRAQKTLIDDLNIARLFAVIGGCLGGQEALEWAITYPAAVWNSVVISATPSASAHSIAIFSVMSRLIRDDPAWNCGNYYDGEFPTRGLRNALVAAVPLWMSSDVMEQRFGRKLHGSSDYRFSLESEFEVESFLEGVAERAQHSFDPNGLLYLMRATQYFDLAHTYTSLPAALARITARVLLISYESDWRYPPSLVEELQIGLRACGKDSRHVRLTSAFGHGAFLHDLTGCAPAIGDFLAACTRSAGRSREALHV
jgi:homoserine O-acetyltransferase/O-succinyltransferase